MSRGARPTRFRVVGGNIGEGIEERRDSSKADKGPRGRTLKSLEVRGEGMISGGEWIISAEELT